MKKIGIIKTFFTLMEEKKWSAASEFLSDYFMISGDSLSPFDKVEFLFIQKNLKDAIPDLKYNVRNLLFDEGLISGIMEITGTHTAELRIPLLGVQVPPTYTSIKLPAEEFEVWVENDRISDIVLLEHPEGGLNGILKKLDVNYAVKIRA